MTVLAIDCDLHKLYAVDSKGNVVANKVKDVRLIPVGNYETVLFEIAGALDYTDNKAVAHQKRRWTIFNIYQATILDHLCGPRAQFAPSSVWTKTFSLSQRHLLAGVTGMNKDLRECAAMLSFWQRDPKVWTPLHVVMGSL